MEGDAEMREKQCSQETIGKKETIEKPCGKALVPPQGINITILLSCFADKHKVGEIDCKLPISMQTPDRLEPED